MNIKTIFIGVSLCTNSAFANTLNEIERITVSADFRQQDIQLISGSVSVLTQDDLQARQAQYLDEILNLAANVNFNSGASRGRFIQIRGIGERSQYSEPVNPSVGLLIDGFDFSGLTAVGTLFDVQQVEILRGPHATEFGAAGMAGTIKIKTNDADSDSQPTIFEITAAEKGTWGIGAAGGGELKENVFFRLSLNQFKSDGFIDNTYLHANNTDNLDELSSRLKLKYIASDTLSFGVNYQYFDIDNGYDAFSLENDSKTLSDQPGFDRQKSSAMGLSINKEFSGVDLAGQLTHITSDLAYAYDEDWTYDGFHPWGYSSFDAYFREKDSSSIDIRILSNPSSLLFAESTEWLIGAYATEAKEKMTREYTYNETDFTSSYKPSNVALYTQTTTQLSNHLSLQVGIRLDRFRLDYTNNAGFEENSKETMVGGKVGLSYTNTNSTVYGSVSRGYKAGGFNPDQRVSPAKRIFKPEYNWNYEFGVKGRIPEEDITLRLAVFYMDRLDTQVSDYDVETRQDGTSTFIDIIGNANTGTNRGLEFEGNWQVTDKFYISASYGYLDATFEGYTLADGTVVDKQDQAQAPKHTFSIVGNFQLSEVVDIKVDFEGKDTYRFSDGHEVRSPFTALANAYISYTMKDWTFSLWGKNILNRRYYVRGFGGFSNDPRDGYSTPTPYYQLGDGRQFGATARYVY